MPHLKNACHLGSVPHTQTIINYGDVSPNLVAIIYAEDRVFTYRIHRAWHRIAGKPNTVDVFEPQLGWSENSVPLNPMVHHHFP